MLYVTTRDDRNPVTSNYPLAQNRGPGNGFFLPFHPPVMNCQDSSLNGRIASILNRLFGMNLTAWDLDFGVGRHPVQLKALSQKILIAECFHNPGWCMDALISSAAKLVQLEGEQLTNWVEIGIRIAVLTGILGELPLNQEGCVDVCMVGGNFSGIMAAWYARKWGLPIGNIICCCNENQNVWNLLTQGQMRTDAVSVHTIVPEGDISIPENLERLIYEIGGTAEVEQYLDVCGKGAVYSAKEEHQEKLRQGLCVSVVSSQRILRTIPGVFGTHGYLHSPASALAYAGLQDYRARTGIVRPSLILAESSPSKHMETVAGAMGISVKELESYL